MTLAGTTSDWYREYYRRRGRGRNDLLRNPEVLFQVLARDVAVIRSVASMDLDPAFAEVLDVGTGDGVGLAGLVRLGFSPERLHGLDIQEDRVAAARASSPHLDVRVADASVMPYENDAFDVVTEWTMFTQVAEDVIARKIAAEMIRVTRPGGHILLVDWSWSRPLQRTYGSLSARRIRRLFDVGRRTAVHSVHRGALAPPVGRFLSRRIPGSYFAVQALLPFLVAQRATVLERLP